MTQSTFLHPIIFSEAHSESWPNFPHNILIEISRLHPDSLSQTYSIRALSIFGEPTMTIHPVPQLYNLLCRLSYPIMNLQNHLPWRALFRFVKDLKAKPLPCNGFNLSQGTMWYFLFSTVSLQRKLNWIFSCLLATLKGIVDKDIM